VHAPGTSYFLPINDLTLMYINGLLEILNEHTAAYILDERAGFQPAGLKKFAKSKGGHLFDNPDDNRVATVGLIERLVTEFVTVEQGMLLQNLGLMTEALGLGGFPNFSNHDFSWFRALGFKMIDMPASQFLGMRGLPRLALKILSKDKPVPYPIGLEVNGETLLKPFIPPYFASMREAVEAVVDYKFGPQGTYARADSWKKSVSPSVAKVSDETIEATVAYCEYLWTRYGRFPVHMPPFRTVLGFQAGHLDLEFYEKFYRPDAVGESQRRDFQETIRPPVSPP
jgi:hypothetical protein